MIFDIIYSCLQVNRAYVTFCVSAQDGDRTRTIISNRGGLSPLRLPIPPPGQVLIY